MSKLYRNNFPPLAEVVKDFNLDGWKLIDILKCPICGSAKRELVSKRDRYGFPLPFYLCMNCAVVYLGRRFTDHGYHKFYKSWYHRLVSAYWEQCFGPRRYRREQRNYGAVIVPQLLPHLKGRRYRILDIGGAIGLYASMLQGALAKKNIETQVTVLDPNKSDLAQAKKKGLSVLHGLVEDHDLGENSFDLILVCRSIEHVISPGAVMRQSHRALTKGGMLFCDYVTLEQTLIKRGIPGCLQLDHIYAFTKTTFLGLCMQNGFVPLAAGQRNRIEEGYVFKKTRPMTPTWSQAHAHWLLGRLRKFTKPEAMV